MCLTRRFQRFSGPITLTSRFIVTGGLHSTLDFRLSLDHRRLLLSFRAELRRLESVVLGHGLVGPVEAIENQLPEEWIADLFVDLRFVVVEFGKFWEGEPRFRGHLCHRLQSLERLATAGLPLPQTAPKIGIPLQVRSILRAP